jgi:hypothetical protein
LKNYVAVEPRGQNVLRLDWDADAMTDEIKNTNSRVERSASGGFVAVWRGQVVYENGRVKKFEAEKDARAHLDRCDAAGKIVH